MIAIAINGFGRIGRNIVRALYENQYNKHIQVVAINEVAEPKAIAHLLKYDTSHGRFSEKLNVTGQCLTVREDKISLLHQRKIEDIDFNQLVFPKIYFSLSIIK